MRMSFREKSAWISLLCLLIFTGIWLAHFARINFFTALAHTEAAVADASVVDEIKRRATVSPTEE